ncbi:MAG: threonine/serine exporter family protein [Clostridia bacterium]|nr:threonine/serine exporter family protein [Clostridia bacterium]
MINMTIQVLGAFAAAITLSIMFDIPKKHIIVDGIVGAAGWLCYLLVTKVSTVYFAVFFASLLVALSATVLSKVLRTPTTVLMIPGLLPMVPGVSIYRVVYYTLENEPELIRHYLLEALQIAAMIAFAILIVETVFRAIANASALYLRKQYTPTPKK